VAPGTGQSNVNKALFVEYSKTFDDVDHAAVLSKMAALKADSIFALDAFFSIKPPTTRQDWVHSVSMDHSQWRDAARNVFWPLRILDADTTICTQCSIPSNSWMM